MSHVVAETRTRTAAAPTALLASCAFFAFIFIGSLLMQQALGYSPIETSLASGLIETMREVGGATGVAGVSTVLVAGSGIGGFHTAFLIIAVLLVLGVISANLGGARRA